MWIAFSYVVFHEKLTAKEPMNYVHKKYKKEN